MLAAVGWKSSNSYFLVTVQYIRSVLVLFSKARLGVSKIPRNEWNWLYITRKMKYWAYIYIYMPWLSLCGPCCCLCLTRHLISSAIFGSEQMRVTSRYFSCVPSLEKEISKIIGTVSVTRVHFVLKHGSRLKFLERDPWNEKLPTRQEGAVATSQLHSYMFFEAEAASGPENRVFAPLNN